MIINKSENITKSVFEMVNPNHCRINAHYTFYENKVNGMLNENHNSESFTNLGANKESHGVEQDKCFENLHLKYGQYSSIVENSEYQTLPEKYFKHKDLPPPLVSTSWLKLFYEESAKEKNYILTVDSEEISILTSETDENESSEEDSVPLSVLRVKCGSAQKEVFNFEKNNALNCSREPPFHNADQMNSKINIIDKKELCMSNIPERELQSNNIIQDNSNEINPKYIKTNSTKSSNAVIIQRKRGRPKKQEQTLPNFDCFLNNRNDFLNDLDLNEKNEEHDEWWNHNVDSSDNSLLGNNQMLKENEDCIINNFEENESVQSIDVENIETKSKIATNVKKKKKDLKDKVQGIKIENSKLIFPCMECGKSFSAASTLKYHMRIHNGTLIKCPECDRGFTTNYLLKCHMRIHNGDLFMCHKCGRGFTTAELLKVHSRSHTGIRPYKCEICGKSFPSASNLTQHKETHEPEKKYLCFQCGSSFTQKRCLDGHMLSHGEKNHICTVCGKLWARKSDLTEHMRVHTGYKPYACNYCPQKFTQASSLRRHQIVHKDGNPVQCLTCGKMLKCDEYYKRHLKKHEKDQEFQISIPVE